MTYVAQFLKHYPDLHNAASEPQETDVCLIIIHTSTGTCETQGEVNPFPPYGSPLSSVSRTFSVFSPCIFFILSTQLSLISFSPTVPLSLSLFSLLHFTPFLLLFPHTFSHCFSHPSSFFNFPTPPLSSLSLPPPAKHFLCLPSLL